MNNEVKENVNNSSLDDADIENKPKFLLMNIMEEIVFLKTKEIIRFDKDACKCEKCLNDICAIVLNSVKPKYATTEVGSLYARALNVDTTEVISISVEIAKAIELVKQRPIH